MFGLVSILDDRVFGDLRSFHEQFLNLSEEQVFRSLKARLNLTIKEIPKTVLSRCEWGRDDYSLEVQSLERAPAPAGQQPLFAE